MLVIVVVVPPIPRASAARAGDDAGAGPDHARDARWWPVQSVPAGLVRSGDHHAFPEPRLAHQMLVQSVAGLAAKSVNAGSGDELVWVGTGNPDVEAWGTRALGRAGAPAMRGEFGPWELVERFARRGIVKGYILYRADRSAGELNEHRPGMDLSVNVATSLAGVLDGVIVDEALEGEARARGLELLLDARDKTQAWCFETYRERFGRRMLCTQDPRKPNARDLAIAHRALTVYGPGEPLAEAMAWLEPLSPILGWNGGDEFDATRLSSVHGHLQTATDWCMNLPVLMAGSERAAAAAGTAAAAAAPRVRGFDPRGIDWSDRRSGVCFVASDGDNVQWLTGDFFANRSYWASPDRGAIPFGWSACLAHLAQLCPPALEHAAATQAPRDRFVEWGGGYYYPDLFARDRPDRWALLARHARRTWAFMERTGARVIGFNVAQHDAPDALRAYEVFAGETDGLLAILVFQYAPYEAGAGRVYWVRDRRGAEVPVITARYSIWADANARPRAGTPAKVAREVRQTLASTPAAELPRYDWAIAHAWSYFRAAPGTGDGDDAEAVPSGAPAPPAARVRGYTPVTWCADRLPADVRVIDPEEMAWRLRMRRNPAETRAAVDRFRP
jgi:hypothetical protein